MVKNKIKYLGLWALLCGLLVGCSGRERVFYARDFGVLPDTGMDYAAEIAVAVEHIRQECAGAPSRLIFEAGSYDFYPDRIVRELYISNHDQHNPKHIGILLEGLQNFTLDGAGADFYVNGRMLPIVMQDCENCRLENFSVDSRIPQITQVKILENDPEQGTMVYELAPYVQYEVVNNQLVVRGENWQLTPTWGIAFDPQTYHLVYRTSDIWVGATQVEEIRPRVLKAQWRDARLQPGTIVAMRSYARPTPGIFLYGNRNTRLQNVTVHYAEGMGLLAQVCENIVLEQFNVSLREGTDRYFTTQADATHFSGCRGHIRSVGGLYEGMMDDAINVHGTYLRITERLNNREVLAQYKHPQAWGFYWGGAGDSVQFVQSQTMEVAGSNRLVDVVAVDAREADPASVAGAKTFRLCFEHPVAEDIANGNYGIENLAWTPSVYFADNVIRNNRARGALFSTPAEVLIENNFFDHTSGTAILLCGDCNGWFETGACRNVVIRKNHFRNALTNLFQFTNAIISIYPEIPALDQQTLYFHGGPQAGIVIEDNLFETFDKPLVYAKSLDGLTFRNNRIVQNEDFPAFHWNQEPFLLERVQRVVIENNEFDQR